MPMLMYSTCCASIKPRTYPPQTSSHTMLCYGRCLTCLSTHLPVYKLPLYKYLPIWASTGLEVDPSTPQRILDYACGKTVPKLVSIKFSRVSIFSELSPAAQARPCGILKSEAHRDVAGSQACRRRKGCVFWHSDNVPLRAPAL